MTIRSNDPSPEYTKEFKAASQKDICTPIFIAALFTVAKRGKEPKCPLTDEGIKTMRCMHTIECYTAFQKEIRPCATIGMNPDDIKLSEISQLQRTNTV